MKVEEAIRYFERELEKIEEVECCNGDEDTCRRCPLTELHGLIYGE